jgi:hypothetical protein
MYVHAQNMLKDYLKINSRLNANMHTWMFVECRHQKDKNLDSSNEKYGFFKKLFFSSAKPKSAFNAKLSNWAEKCKIVFPFV